MNAVNERMPLSMFFDSVDTWSININEKSQIEDLIEMITNFSAETLKIEKSHQLDFSDLMVHKEDLKKY
jgi:hypothetical protein